MMVKLRSHTGRSLGKKNMKPSASRLLEPTPWPQRNEPLGDGCPERNMTPPSTFDFLCPHPVEVQTCSEVLIAAGGLVKEEGEAWCLGVVARSWLLMKYVGGTQRKEQSEWLYTPLHLAQAPYCLVMLSWCPCAWESERLSCGCTCDKQCRQCLGLSGLWNGQPSFLLNHSSLPP